MWTHLRRLIEVMYACVGFFYLGVPSFGKNYFWVSFLVLTLYGIDVEIKFMSIVEFFISLKV